MGQFRNPLPTAWSMWHWWLQDTNSPYITFRSYIGNCTTSHSFSFLRPPLACGWPGIEGRASMTVPLCGSLPGPRVQIDSRHTAP